MAEVDSFTLYNLLMGTLAGLGLLYLLYVERLVIGYRRFLVVMTFGLLLFAVGGPLAHFLFPPFEHVVHGLAALFVIFGLYDPLHNDLRKDEWAALLLEDPSVMRYPAGWMVPLDDRILELFHSTDLVLTPAIIAYNLDYSREEVNRRLSEMERHGLVERVERGKYRLSDMGGAYLRGALGGAPLEMERG